MQAHDLVVLRKRTVRGTVKVWHAEAGWGVLVSLDAPGEVWAHFSAIEGSGFRYLREGAVVEFKYRRVLDQDGYKFVADHVRTLP